MKRRWKILLTILAVAAVSVIVAVVVFFNGQKPFVGKEEQKEMVVGEWIDPKGVGDPYVFREDGTGHMLGQDFTWEISRVLNAVGGKEYPTILVDYYFAGSKEAAGYLSFDYYEKWDLTLCACADSEVPEVFPLSWYRCKKDSVEIVELTTENWDTYFEIAGTPEWSESYSGKTNWDRFANYLYLKPEYADKYLDMRQVYENQFYYELFVQTTMIPQIGKADENTGTFEVVDWNENGEIEQNQYNMGFYINDVDLRLHQREDGAAEIVDLETPSDTSYGSDGIHKETYIIPYGDINAVHASGTLVFAKQYDETKDPDVEKK